MVQPPHLYIFSGLPGVGKTTLAAELAKHLNCVFLRIDTVEQGLRDLCSIKVVGEGYRLSYRLAQDNLRIGNSVIADSCNPIDLSRREWVAVATSMKADFTNIEIICSDPEIHRERVETRVSSIPNLILPTWQAVVEREYHAWDSPRVVVDTAGKSIKDSISELLEKLDKYM